MNNQFSSQAAEVEAGARMGVGTDSYGFPLEPPIELKPASRTPWIS
jgi:hypothetical protein